MRKLTGKDKRGLIGDTFFKIVGLVFGLIIGFVMIAQITGANLLTAGSAEDNATDNLVGNLTVGVDNVSDDVPTLFTIAVAVLIITFVLILWALYKRSGMGTGSL